MNGSVPVVIDEAEAGETTTEVTPGSGGGGTFVTLTVIDPDIAGSALLVAVTVEVPVLVGAVKSPAEVMLPSEAFQVTDLSVAEPRTDADNCILPPGIIDLEAEESVTELTAGADGPAVP